MASMHPVCDEYKTQRTVSLFGAKTLYLKFDDRCATQYDYDKVSVIPEILDRDIIENCHNVCAATLSKSTPGKLRDIPD